MKYDMIVVVCGEHHLGAIMGHLRLRTVILVFLFSIILGSFVPNVLELVDAIAKGFHLILIS